MLINNILHRRNSIVDHTFVAIVVEYNSIKCSITIDRFLLISSIPYARPEFLRITQNVESIIKRRRRC